MVLKIRAAGWNARKAATHASGQAEWGGHAAMKAMGVALQERRTPHMNGGARECGIACKAALAGEASDSPDGQAGSIALSPGCSILCASQTSMAASSKGPTNCNNTSADQPTISFRWVK